MLLKTLGRRGGRSPAFSSPSIHSGSSRRADGCCWSIAGAWAVVRSSQDAVRACAAADRGIAIAIVGSRCSSGFSRGGMFS